MIDMICWNKFPEVKPPIGQVCLVCAGSNGPPRIQYVALRWDGEDFSWMDDEEESAFDDFPTDEAKLWAKFPDDPIY